MTRGTRGKENIVEGEKKPTKGKWGQRGKRTRGPGRKGVKGKNRSTGKCLQGGKGDQGKG
jgi:hypothetical protein